MRANLYVTITGTRLDGGAVDETLGNANGVTVVLEKDMGTCTDVRTALLGTVSTAMLMSICRYGVNAFGRWQMIRAALWALCRPRKPITPGKRVGEA